MKKKCVFAIIPSAGESKRFGGFNKLNQLLNNKPVILHTLDNIKNSMAVEIIVVTGKYHDEIERVLENSNIINPNEKSTLEKENKYIGSVKDGFNKAKRRINFVHNPDFFKGMSSSIITGVKYIMENFILNDEDGILFLNADMPFVSTEIINYCISKYQLSKKGIVFPVYNNMRGHPVIFAKKYISSLLNLSGDEGAKNVIKKNIKDVEKIVMLNDSIIKDIDTKIILEKFNKLSYNLIYFLL